VTDPRRTHAYQVLARRVRTEESTCWLCSQPIDLALPYRDPDTGRVNRMCWSLDHVLPVDTHPELALDRRNARAAHFTCNSARGARPPAGPRAKRGPVVTTRQW
jgi:5-methylcytosine-specific restriction endonuclease McrA